MTEHTRKIAESEMVVGDALDDLADIVADLEQILWRLSNTSEADAVWHFRFLYKSHFGEHALGLLGFLHWLEVEV